MLFKSIPAKPNLKRKKIQRNIRKTRLRMRDEKCKLCKFVAVKDNITPTSQQRGSKKATEKGVYPKTRTFWKVYEMATTTSMARTYYIRSKGTSGYGDH